MCRAFGSIILKEDSQTPYFKWIGKKSSKDVKLLNYGDSTIFRDEELLLIEGECEQETIKVIKCHRPQISSKNTRLELKKMLRVVIASGPFNVPQNAEV